MPAKYRIDFAKENFWRAEFEKQQVSGLSGPEYCRLHGHKYSLFADWRTRLRKLDASGGIPKEVRQESSIDWLGVIERARAFPDGIAAFLAAHGIEEKLYYRRFRKLRKTHPEWKNLTRRGRKGGAKKKSGEPCRSPKASVQAGAVPRNEQNFAPVQLVDPCRNLTVNDQSSVEIILPNSLVLRIPAGCPTEYLASIVLAMRGL